MVFANDGINNHQMKIIFLSYVRGRGGPSIAIPWEAKSGAIAFGVGVLPISARAPRNDSISPAG